MPTCAEMENVLKGEAISAAAALLCRASCRQSALYPVTVRHLSVRLSVCVLVLLSVRRFDLILGSEVTPSLSDRHYYNSSVLCLQSRWTRRSFRVDRQIRFVLDRDGEVGAESQVGWWTDRWVSKKTLSLRVIDTGSDGTETGIWTRPGIVSCHFLSASSSVCYSLVIFLVFLLV